MNTFSEHGWETRSQVEQFRYPLVGGALADVPSQNGVSDENGEEEARKEGLREGELRARREYEQSLRREREAMQQAIRNFGQECDRYYQRVEQEVVQLALSIARKVLHRESQVDPLLLAGIVRVALRKLEAGTQVKIRVHPAEAALWRKSLAEESESGRSPCVEEDESVSPHQCVVQTELGVTELGIEPQLKEIENGLLDLLAQRPQVDK
jgi:flagellar assembly protein FliH